MSSGTTFNAFPSTRVEALTILYLQNQDLSSLTPEELAKKYSEVFSAIKQAFQTGKGEEWLH